MQNFPTLFVIMTRLSARLSQGSFVSGVLLRSTERSCNHVMQKNLRPVPPSPPQPPSPPPPPKKKRKYFRGKILQGANDLLYVFFSFPSARRGLFPFRKQAMPFLTVDAIFGNQAFQKGQCHICFIGQKCPRKITMKP